MRIHLPDIDNRTGPIYAAIAEALAGDIERGQLKPGERLPTHRQLARELGVTVGTIAHAYTDLARRGLVVAGPGRGGTTVRKLEPFGDQAGPGDSPGQTVIDLTTNRPATELFSKEMALTLGALSRRQDLASLQEYRSDAGAEAHRDAGAAWIARTALADAAAENVVVCNGTQHALCVALMALTRPGHAVFTEALTYAGLRAIAARLHLDLYGLAMDADGLRPDSFEEACRSGLAKVLVCVPSIHNPTTVTMPEGRRQDIAEIAVRHGVTIVEDDVHGPLLANRPPAIANFAPEHTVLITGTSKAIAPGLRVGYALAPQQLLGQLIAGVRATTWMASPLMAEIASIWINDGTAGKIIHDQRRELAAREAMAVKAFRGLSYKSHASSLHFWLQLPQPWRTDEFVGQARNHSVAVVPSEAYAVGRSDIPHAVRINLGAARSRAELEQGLNTLKDVLSHPPEPTNPLA